MKNNIKFILVFSIMLFNACKSAEFKAQRNIVKSEIADVLKSIVKENETKLALTSQIMKMVSVFDIDDRTTVNAVNKNRKTLSEFNTDFVNKNLSKRMISKYFKKQIELSNNLNKLFKEFDSNSQISSSRNYNDLRSAFVRNNKKTKDIFRKYNGIIEKNSDYINYTKFNISGL